MAERNKDPLVALARGLYSSLHYWMNLDKRKQQIRAWQQANPDKELARYRRYWKEQPERMRAKAKRDSAIRRARVKKATIGDLEDINEVYSRCEQLRSQGHDVVVDHKMPLSRGGSHSADNLQIIFTRENLSKNNSLAYQPTRVFEDALDTYTKECIQARRGAFTGSPLG